MYVEERYYDNGKVQAKMHLTKPEEPANTDGFDYYLEECESLEEWLESVEIELDDVVPLILALNAGGWVDITRYV